MNKLPVLVGYDGSASSSKALDWAAAEASRRQVPLKVLYADPIPLPLNSVQLESTGDERDRLQTVDSDLLDEVTHAVKEANPELDVEAVLSTLMPTEALVDHGRTASMVVLGRRGAGGLAGLALGSKALQVATHGHCPTVVIPREDAAAGDQGPEHDRIVVGVESADASGAAISFAFEQAALLGVGVTAVHAWEAPFFDAPGGKGGGVPRAVLQADMADEVSAEQDLLDQALVGYADKYPDVDLRKVVVHQRPAQALVAASPGARMVVVGSRGRGSVASRLLGSVSYRVLHQAHSAVAVVRPFTS
jgi:nucleotide-binding universal stress UspA family protein